MNSKPKVSILVLTHNRPELFDRCMKTVFNNIPEWAEVIVNNDGCPVHAFVGAEYYSEVNEDISKTYEFLFNKARGEYVYFLEDDDFVIKYFWDTIEVDIKTNENILYRYLPEGSVKKYIEYFVKEPNLKEHFQLSQMLFKKADLKEFPTGNNIHNDWKIYEQMSFKDSKITIFTQTTDGKDNISFPEFNKDERFIYA